MDNVEHAAEFMWYGIHVVLYKLRFLMKYFDAHTEVGACGLMTV